jgi:hypothetical protein
MNKRGIHIAIEEAKKYKKERTLESVFLFITLVSTFLLLILFSYQIFLTGYATYLSSKAGYITEVDVIRSIPTEYWDGVYGLALRVPGFTEQLSEEIYSGEIVRKDIFFDCIETGATGGNEVYASTSSSIDFDSLQPADLGDVDSYISCSGRPYCPSNTFINNMSILVGSTNISNIPSTHTYKWDGDNGIFDIGILNDSNNLVYVTHISGLQKGYNPNVTVNFQLLLPSPPNSTEKFYFFTDPYDNCPEGGGIGNTLNMTLYGYVKDIYGNYLNNTLVSVAGEAAYTNPLGFYNFTASVIPGTYNLIAIKSGYDYYFSTVSANFSNYIIEKNITMSIYSPGLNETISPRVYGYVKDSSGNLLSDVNVSLGSDTVTTNSTGFYSFYPIIVPAPHPITAIKSGYDNYYYILNFTNLTTSLNHNISMNEIIEEQPYNYATGPYTSPPGQQVRRIVEEAIERGEDYWISSKEIKKEVRQNTFVEEFVHIYNFRSSMSLTFSLSSDIKEIIKLDKNSLSVPHNSFGSVKLTIYGNKPLGIYNGTLNIGGSVEKEIPISIKIVEKRLPIETLLMKIELLDRIVRPGQNLKYKLNLQNLLRDQKYKVSLNSLIKKTNDSEIYASKDNEIEITHSLTLLDEIKVPENVSDGDYMLRIKADYLNLISTITAPFIVARPLYLYSFFGIPVWLILSIIAFFGFIFLNFFLYKKHKEKKKRYRISLDTSTLPKQGPKTIKLGKVAETKTPAYLELEKMKTHTIVAGATGMGKSISAQVIVEEALINNVAVIVFDPTAQWSGMLRKCEDKKMMSFYPKFGLKPSDAKAFPGNIRQVKDARQIIEVNKFINPGQIQIFTLNKLDPKDIDIFVANVIRQIFRSDPQESPDLKVLLVFDEVHRLLSRFGGSGEGFLQIERACREFRKWGMGLVLISQVLSDFVGEIKANINTEVQTRTIEESDLERIKTKYGEEFLKSLVRAEVGVAMFQNSDYNRGRPYFINFRPILHNTRRLSDEELEKYNKYNDIVDDLEYQIEQLEKEKVDVFDLKMELKLVKDKIMTGNFSIVEIYLEGLKPRVEKQWEKLGKKPKKRKIKLAKMEDIKKSIEEAKKERKKVEEKEKKQKKAEKAQEQKKEKKENLEDKQVKPLTFDNGIMVSSLKELKSVLPNLDNEIFKIHVNDKKNDIAEWLKQISEKHAEKIKSIKDKQKLIQELENIGKKEKTEEKKDDKNKSNKTESENKQDNKNKEKQENQDKGDNKEDKQKQESEKVEKQENNSKNTENKDKSKDKEN